MHDPDPFQPPRKKGMSTGAKIGIGCGVTALLLILVCGGITWYAVRHFMGEARAFAADFESRGYVRQSAQVINISQPLNQPTVFLAQTVSINAPVDGSLAFGVQVAEINANVNGDIDFYGQILKISPGVVVTGDVRIKLAQAFDNKGTVQGQVTGNYSGARPPSPPSPPTPPPPAADSGDEGSSSDQEP